MTNEDKWINVDPRTKKLILRFRVRGFSRQFFISSGLKDTKRNREIVRTKRDAILTDVTLGRFDSSLNSYQFQSNQSTKIEPELKTKYQYNLQELWHKFTEFKAPQLEQTTILIRYKNFENHIARLPTQSLDDAVKIRDWALANLSRIKSWELLDYLSRCCQWASDSGLIPDNPFLKLKIQKPKRKSTDSVQKAFKLEERDLIIEAFEKHQRYAHYSPLIKFLFWTGCRPGEAFALTWSDISEDCCRISVTKSCNALRIKKGTKNGIRRVFPVSNGSRLQILLLSIRPATPYPQELVFTSKNGKPMTSLKMFEVWKESRSSTHPKYIGVVQALADEGKLTYLNPYATRHTFATWAISSGISPDKVALWIGDKVETVLKYYCHPEIVNAECPDF